MIIIDKREPPEMKRHIIESKVPYEIKIIQVGDYVIPLSDEPGDAYAFERKTVSDWRKSLFSRRLFRQLKSLMQYKHPCILIEGEMPMGISADTWHELKTLYVQIIGHWVGFQPSIIFTPTPKATAAWVILTWKKIDKSRHEISKPQLLQRIPVGTDPRQVRCLMLTALKGVGISTADVLIGKYKTPIGIALADTKELSEVKINNRRIGLPRAKYIQGILKGDDNS